DTVYLPLSYCRNGTRPYYCLLLSEETHIAITQPWRAKRPELSSVSRCRRPSRRSSNFWPKHCSAILEMFSYCSPMDLQKSSDGHGEELGLKRIKHF